MQIVILMAFMIMAVTTMTVREGYGLALPTGWAMLLAAAYVALAAAFEGLLTIRTLRRMTRVPEAAMRKRDWREHLVQAYLLAGFAALLAGGLGRSLLWATGVPLLGETLMMAPFAAALAATWWMQYPVHRAMRSRLAQRLGGARRSMGILPMSTTGVPPVALGQEPQQGNGREHGQDAAGRLPIWSKGQFIVYNFRFQFLFIAAPLGLIFLIHDVIMLHIWPALSPVLERQLGLSQDWRDALAAGSLLTATLAVLLVAPMIVVWVWRTRPLPAGELREELQAALARLKLRCRQILLWESGGVVANAAVLGIVPQARYVLLSDALLANMPRQQLEAVFAHEAGHILSHHLFYCMLFSISTILLAGAGETLVLLATGHELLSQVAAVTILAGLWAAMFGRISRAMERQSDVIGAWLAGTSYNQTGQDDRVTAEGAAVFAQALQQVAAINGIAPDAPNWRHGSIQSRIGYIFFLGARGGSRREIDRTVGRIKLSLWAMFAASVAAIVATQILCK